MFVGQEKNRGKIGDCRENLHSNWCLENMNGKQAKEKIGRLRGIVEPVVVSSNTNYVIVGENIGSKYEKVKELGIIAIDEETFLQLLKNNAEFL